MKGNAKRLVPLAVVLVAGVSIAVAVGTTSVARTDAPAGQERRVRFAVSLPPGSDVRSLGYIVRSSHDEPLASGAIPVDDARSAVTAEITLPQGTNDTVTFIANPGAAVAGRSSFIAKQAFDVVAEEENGVEIAATHFAPLATGVAGAGAGASASAVASGAPSCQACQLASDQGRCDPELLTATWNTDPNHDRPSWGCDTLASAPLKAACAALLHCLATTRCAQGDSPVAKCYCGSASAVPCFAGDGIDGPCIASYRTAAAASSGGPDPTASDAELSRFVATYATNPTTPIGLADNLDECALAARCEACDSL